MRKLLFHIAFFIFSATVASGQDIHFSQFMYNPVQRAATEAGNFDGDIRISALHRRQWSSVSVPYRTFTVSADGKLNALNEKLKGFSAGLLISQDAAGDGNLSQLNGLLALCYSLRLDADSVHYFRLGFNGGFGQRSIDFQKLNFDNQFNGDIYNPLSPSGESPDNTSVTFPDFGIAAGWTGIFDDVVFDAGFEINHLNKPDISFMNEGSTKLPPLMQITTSAAIDKQGKLYWLPALTFMQQEKFTEITGGVEGVLRINTNPVKRTSISGTVLFRNADAVIPGIALYYNKFRLGFTYDVNVSGLVPASNHKGGPEFSLTYIAKKIRAVNNGSRTCPVY